MAIQVSEEEKKIREERRKKLFELMDVHHIKSNTLANYTNINKVAIAMLRNGSQPLTDKRWATIMAAIDKIIKDHEGMLPEEKQKLKDAKKPGPKRVNRIDPYILENLATNGNTIIMKKCVKDKNALLVTLKEKGYDCRIIDTESSHLVLEDKTKFGEHETQVKVSKVVPHRGRPKKIPTVEPKPIPLIPVEEETQEHPKETVINRMGELTFQLIDTCQEILRLYERVNK